ncbi:MAG: DUF2058 family protein [Deltaproteobacteria bacterium]|nr:DUF2058 family protein [Deltaproteobacteria bacterium]
MQDLRDKLLKAGLVTREQADQATRKEPPAAPRARPVQAPAEPRVPRLPPLALPGTAAHSRLLALQQQELDAKIRQAVKAGEVPLEPGEVTFHFVTRKQKLRRLELSASQAKALEDGTLAVVERPEPGGIEHALVPAAVADQLALVSSKVVRFYNRPGAPVGFAEAAPAEGSGDGGDGG